MLRCLFTLFYALLGAQSFKRWDFSGTLIGSSITHDVTISDSERNLFHTSSSCSPSGNPSHKDFLQFRIYDASTQESLIYHNQECDGDNAVRFSHPETFTNSYKLEISGRSGIEYQIEVVLNHTKIDLVDDTGFSSFEVPKDQLIIKSFTVSQEDITPYTDYDYSYIQVEVTSPDMLLDPVDSGPNSRRYVGKLMVTEDPEDLAVFYENPEADIHGAMRLSFSTFGMLTISDASMPPLHKGTWIVGIAIKHSVRKVVDYTKRVTITIRVVKDYGYVDTISVLFAVSLLGAIIPVLARAIFDAGNMDFTKFQSKMWRVTIRNWFWSGKKGLTYLTALLAALLIVSAFQVVHAKYQDMYSSGNRDICFYNEKCYRPYGSYYDVSVNGISSNLPFMVHGALLVVYFSIAEAFCRSKGHQCFDYSIPYAFGLAFICEGFGSLLYHICPSQIIFQFDTLFMFVISIISIIAIFEGNSIRDNDLKYSVVQKHKAIRTSKVFAFFIGPVYFFNFIGNLIATEGLPVPVIIVFYCGCAIWWILILSWAAYKLDLFPDSWDPEHLPQLENELQVAGSGLKPAPYPVQGRDTALNMKLKLATTMQILLKHSRRIKLVMFTLYCCLVAAGFVLCILNILPFSIFILGMLVVAQITLTLVFFIPFLWTVLEFFYNLPIKIATQKLTCSFSKHIFVVFGIVIYVLAGCTVVGISLVFFTVLAVTDKSIPAWRSREMNQDCYLNGFYDTHDFWHLFASFALMMMTMIVVQISKPCRECYISYLEKKKTHIRRMTVMMRSASAPNPTLSKDTSENGFKNPGF